MIEGSVPLSCSPRPTRGFYTWWGGSPRPAGESRGLSRGSSAVSGGARPSPGSGAGPWNPPQPRGGGGTGPPSR